MILIVSTSLCNPFKMYLCMGLLKAIPDGLYKTSVMDGASQWQASRLVLLPLSMPILTVVFMLSFIAAIIDLQVISLLLRNVKSYTLAVRMQQYINPQNSLWGDLAALAVLSAISITAVFQLAQRRQQAE